MPVTEVATRIMIFLSEDDRLVHHGLHDAILDRAREDGMAGATVWRGLEGFGSSGHVRTARFPDAATGLPLAVELVDAPERIEAFLAVVQELAPGSFVTREEVQMSRFGAAPARGLDDEGPQGTHQA
jgi:PII-like signaling protein